MFNTMLISVTMTTIRIIIHGHHFLTTYYQIVFFFCSKWKRKNCSL